MRATVSHRNSKSICEAEIKTDALSQIDRRVISVALIKQIDSTFLFETLFSRDFQFFVQPVNTVLNDTGTDEIVNFM